MQPQIIWEDLEISLEEDADNFNNRRCSVCKAGASLFLQAFKQPCELQPKFGFPAVGVPYAKGPYTSMVSTWLQKEVPLSLLWSLCTY